jgi:hypothetical protein
MIGMDDFPDPGFIDELRRKDDEVEFIAGFRPTHDEAVAKLRSTIQACTGMDDCPVFSSQVTLFIKSAYDETEKQKTIIKLLASKLSHPVDRKLSHPVDRVNEMRQITQDDEAKANLQDIKTHVTMLKAAGA